MSYHLIFFFVFTHYAKTKSNLELYFPPDTPVGRVNSKRHYKLLLHRHSRQQQRLIQQQVTELNEFKKNFSIEHKEDLFTKPKITACESIKGSHYLETQSQDITLFLSTIPSYIQQNEIQMITVKDKEKELAEDKADERKQEYIGILKVKYTVLLCVHKLIYNDRNDIKQDLI
jgi:hypothetical protein